MAPKMSVPSPALTIPAVVLTMEPFSVRLLVPVTWRSMVTPALVSEATPKEPPSASTPPEDTVTVVRPPTAKLPPVVPKALTKPVPPERSVRVLTEIFPGNASCAAVVLAPRPTLMVPPKVVVELPAVPPASSVV